MEIIGEINIEDFKQSLGADSREAIAKAMYLVTMHMWDETRGEAPRFRGQLRGSIKWDMVDDLVGRVYSDLIYSAAVLYGTEPIPNAPYTPIAEWAEKKGLPAFPVWYKIRTEGISENRFDQRAWNKTKGQLQKYMDMAVQATGGA